MEVNIEIETYDRNLSHNIFEEKEIIKDMEKEIADDIIIKHKGELIAREAITPTVILLTISFSSSLAATLLGNWLYEKIVGKSEKIKIDGQEVPINKIEIIKIFTKKSKGKE